MSAVDEDTELRDLLIQTLDKNGVLGKIKAELRASIFLTLEAQDQVKNPNELANVKLQNFLSKPEGSTCIDVVHEFLEFFNLDYTREVFIPETNTAYSYKSPSQLCQKLGLNVPSEEASSLPVLSKVIAGRSTHNVYSNTLKDAQIKRAQDLFSANCNVGLDSVSSSTAVNILSSLCPRFPLFLLERFVAEEMSTFSSNISLRSFLGMYEKLYTACHSVVSDQPAGSEGPSQQSSNHSIYDKSEDDLIKQTVGLPEKTTDSVRNASLSSQEDAPVSSYDHFFDDDFYSKPPNSSPTKFTDTRPPNSMKLPPLTDASNVVPSASDHSLKEGWLGKDPNSSSEYDKRQASVEYEDDFNSGSHASITEDIQGESLLSSTQSSMADLTEDRSISEKDVRADYLEDVKKF